jgi:flagellar basal-body rod protein FlgC
MTLPPILPPAFPRSDAPRPMFSSLAISATGLSAQRTRMDVIAQNLANAETTRTTQGGPYHRRYVNLEAIAPAVEMNTMVAGLPVPSVVTPDLPTNSVGTIDNTGGVRVTSIGEDKTEGPMIYDPAHPDADKNGYVHMPNVRMTDELMDLMNARRIYEANATVFQVARAMLHKAIEI